MPVRLGLPELAIILVLVVLIFGVGRISKISGELGSAIRQFREGLTGPDKKDEPKPAEADEKDTPKP
jgi:sec-independent protein translocase protein TatA